jgi:predicted transcriptional regulator
MKKSSVEGSTVLTVRVPRGLDRKLTREARRLRQTRSKTACALLESALQGNPDEDPASEARRQSRLASQRASEKEVLAFIANVSDLRGWE